MSIIMTDRSSLAQSENKFQKSLPNPVHLKSHSLQFLHNTLLVARQVTQLRFISMQVDIPGHQADHLVGVYFTLPSDV